MKRIWMILLFGMITFAIVGSGYLYVSYDKYKSTLDKMSEREDRTYSKADGDTQKENALKNNVLYSKEQKNRVLKKIGPEKDDQNEIKKNRRNLNPKDVRVKSNKQRLNRKLQADKLTMLLYGIDKRAGTYDQGRPDTIMLALLDPKQNKISLISMPRDAYVDIPGYRKHKLNTSFSRGGVDLTIETIENWLDIHIQEYASIDFKGFEKLVDLVGGVEVDVDRNMNYDAQEEGTHIHLRKGRQVLNGKMALDFVRFRHSNEGGADSDYKRMARQQQVLSSLGKKVTSYKSITKIFHMLDIVGEHIKTSLSAKELDSYIRSYYKIDIDHIETTSMVGVGDLRNGMWIEIIPKEEVKRIKTIVDKFSKP